MDCQSRRRKSSSFSDEDEARKMSRAWIQDTSTMLPQGVILSTTPPVPQVVDHNFRLPPQSQQQQQQHHQQQRVNEGPGPVPLSLQAAMALQEIRSSIDSAKHSFLQQQNQVVTPKFPQQHPGPHQLHQQQQQQQQQHLQHLQQNQHHLQNQQHQQHLQQNQHLQQQQQHQHLQQSQHLQHLHQSQQQQQQNQLKNLQHRHQQQLQQMPPKGNALLDTRYLQTELQEGAVPKFPQTSSHLMIPPVIFPPSLSGIPQPVMANSSTRLIMQMPKLPNEQLPVVNDLQQSQQQQIQQCKNSPNTRNTWFPASSTSLDMQRPSTSSNTSTSGMNSMFSHEIPAIENQQQQEQQQVGENKLTRGLNPVPKVVQYASSNQILTNSPLSDEPDNRKDGMNEVDKQQQQKVATGVKQQEHQEQRPPTRTFTKVYKLGSIGRAIDVSRFRNYVELRAELSRMFGLEGQLELKNGWQLVFVDKENDLLLVGDDPWEEFVNSVRGIRILSPSEVSYYISDERGDGVV